MGAEGEKKTIEEKIAEAVEDREVEGVNKKKKKKKKKKRKKKKKGAIEGATLVVGTTAKNPPKELKETALESAGEQVSTGSNEDQCSICLDKLNKPVQLPCGHTFCSDCLESWRPSHHHRSPRTCPKCRAPLPVTTEMLRMHEVFEQACSALSRSEPLPVPNLRGEPEYCMNDDSNLIDRILSEQQVLSVRSMDGNPEQQQIALSKALLQELVFYRQKLADLDRAIDASPHVLATPKEDALELPKDVAQAAFGHDVQAVFGWLCIGNPAAMPVPFDRINAKDRECGITLLHAATRHNDTHLMMILLQLGANVEPKILSGITPFRVAMAENAVHAASLLLSWGANEKDVESRDVELQSLVETPFGGRRCEIVGLKGRNDLNGKAGVVTKYLPKEERYVFAVEWTDEKVQVRPANLKRRDRTPKDCGIYCSFEGMDSEGTITYTVSHFCRSEKELEELNRYRKEKGLEISVSHFCRSEEELNRYRKEKGLD